MRLHGSDREIRSAREIGFHYGWVVCHLFIQVVMLC
jgi:hypothetical protein